MPSPCPLSLSIHLTPARPWSAARGVPGLVLAVLTLAAPAAAADGSPAPVGAWQGGGRACAGAFVVRARSLDWRTPYQRCSGVRYRAAALPAEGGAERTLYRLEGAGAACGFSSLELRHRPAAPGTPGDGQWELIGHPSEADREAGRLDAALACPVLRLR